RDGKRSPDFRTQIPGARPQHGPAARGASGAGFRPPRRFGRVLIMAKRKSKSESPPAPIDAEKSAHLESLCSHCGKCCYKKIIVGRTVYISPFPCEFLDTQTNMCTVYDRRHEMNPDCLSMETGFKHSAFPTDCTYVPEMAPKNYKPAREDYNW